MTEDEAKAWTASRVSRGTFATLQSFVDMLVAANEQQNLISTSTVSMIWARHIADSVQLLDLVKAGSWLDLGSGPGLPGLVVAIAGGRPVTLVESRRLRVEFLRSTVDRLQLDVPIEIIHSQLEHVPSRPFDVISARAFAPLARLFPVTYRFAHPGTSWLLPKGRSAPDELASIDGMWQGDFSIVPSVTDPASSIVIGHAVRPGAGQ